MECGGESFWSPTLLDKVKAEPALKQWY